MKFKPPKFPRYVHARCGTCEKPILAAVIGEHLIAEQHPKVKARRGQVIDDAQLLGCRGSGAVAQPR